ncbi:ABC transporter ATP-binding protein [bacterium]|nr:ABC transporter ATP-binding protein [bacterium]
MSAVVVEHVSKTYKLYRRPLDRLLDVCLPGPRRYREFAALSDVSFQLEAGDALGVIGPNGAGKSTLLKILCGIARPSAGRCRLEGRVSALLELGTGFHPEFTGRENIFLSGELLGIPREEMAGRMESIIDFAEIGPFIDAPIRTYSSGMYVRLAFAVASMVDPDVLIVDEALAVGDMYFQKKSIERIKWFVERGKTALFVSHSMELLRRFCNKAMWLDEGRVRALGDVPSVIAGYEHFIQKKEEQKLSEKARAARRAIDEEREARRSRPTAAGFRVFKKSWGTGEIRLTNVEMLGGDGTARWTFQSGEPVCIRLHFHAFQRIEHPIFAVHFHRLDGIYVYAGSNFQIDPTDYPPIEPGQGYVELQIDRLLLHCGTFFLSAGVFTFVDEPYWTTPADWHNQAYEFKVESGMRQHGVVRLPARWLPTVHCEADEYSGVPSEIDLGDEDSFRFLTEGWWDRESDGERAFHWSMEEAEVLVRIPAGATRLVALVRAPRLVGDALPVEVFSGESRWGDLKLAWTEWESVELALPEGASGVRRVRFRPAYVFRPYEHGLSDSRHLGFALARLEAR